MVYLASSGETIERAIIVPHYGYEYIVGWNVYANRVDIKKFIGNFSTNSKAVLFCERLGAGFENKKLYPYRGGSDGAI